MYFVRSGGCYLVSQFARLTNTMAERWKRSCNTTCSPILSNIRVLCMQQSVAVKMLGNFLSFVQLAARSVIDTYLYLFI